MKQPTVRGFALVGIAGMAVWFACLEPANASPLEYVGSFDTNENVEGIAFDAASGDVLTVNLSNNIFRYRTDGALVGSVASEVGDLRGIDVLPNGNLVVASNTTGNERLVEVDPAGAVVAGGIDINLNGLVGDNNGVVFDPATGTLFVADEDADAVHQHATGGTRLSSFPTDGLGIVDTEGIEIDPLTGNLLIGNDLTFGGPVAELFEVTRDGALVSLTDLSVLTGLGSHQLQGLAVGDGRLFAGNGTTNRVDMFVFVPEPGSAAVNLVGLSLLLGRTTRRRGRGATSGGQDPAWLAK